MKTFAVTLALAAALPLLAACGERNSAPQPDPSASAGTPEPETAIGRSVEKAMDKARAKLKTENISLTNFRVNGNDRGVVITTDDGDSDTRPKAEITPQGDLLIEGRKIEANAQQHALLVQYRKQVEGVASAGMDIGVQGAELGVKAATEAIKGIFSGDPDGVEQRVEVEAEKIKLAARRLCDQLPAMLETQDELAAAMPEFKPYATMGQTDIDECYEDDGVDRAQVRARVQHETREEIRSSIRKGIRGAVQGVTQAAGLVSSGTGDTLEVNDIRFLLPPGGVSTNTTKGSTEIEVSNGLRVKLIDGELWVNGEHYPAPKDGGEVDLSTSGTVKVDGKVVAAL